MGDETVLVPGVAGRGWPGLRSRARAPQVQQNRPRPPAIFPSSLCRTMNNPGSGYETLFVAAVAPANRAKFVANCIAFLGQWGWDGCVRWGLWVGGWRGGWMGAPQHPWGTAATRQRRAVLSRGLACWALPCPRAFSTRVLPCLRTVCPRALPPTPGAAAQAGPGLGVPRGNRPRRHRRRQGQPGRLCPRLQGGGGAVGQGLPSHHGRRRQRQRLGRCVLFGCGGSEGACALSGEQALHGRASGASNHSYDGARPPAHPASPSILSLARRPGPGGAAAVRRLVGLRSTGRFLQNMPPPFPVVDH